MIVSWKAFCRSLIIQRCERDGRTHGKQNIWMASWRRSYLKDLFFFFSLRWVTFALQLCDHCFFFSQCSRRKRSTVLTVLNETVARIIFVTWAQREGGCDRSSLSPYTTCSFICTRQGEKYILCDHSQPDFCHLLLEPSKSAPKKDKGDTRSVSLREKPHRFNYFVWISLFSTKLCVHAGVPVCRLHPSKPPACWFYSKLWHHPEKCAPPRSSMFIIYNHCESKAEPQLYRSKWCHRVQPHLCVSVSDASHIW